MDQAKACEPLSGTDLSDNIGSIVAHNYDANDRVVNEGASDDEAADIDDEEKARRIAQQDLHSHRKQVGLRTLRDGFTRISLFFASLN